MTRSGLVPLDELGQGKERVSWNLQLPDYAPTDRIGVDVRRLDRLARLGGFINFNVSGYEGNTIRSLPQIDSINPDGTATSSGRLSIQRTDLQKVHGKEPAFGQSTSYVTGQANVRINVPEMLDRVTASKRPAPLRNPEAWSGVLNDAVGSGLRAATFEHLIKQPGIENKIFLLGTLAVLWGNTNRGALEYFAGNLFGTALWGAGFWFMLKMGAQGRDAPFSVVPFVHLDRVARVSLATRTRRLVRPFPAAQVYPK